MAPPPKRSPPFLPSHTFVLQLSTDVQVESGHIAGRVEHLVSRHATMFQSWAELLAFMTLMLRKEGQEQEETPPTQAERASASPGRAVLAPGADGAQSDIAAPGDALGGRGEGSPRAGAGTVGCPASPG